MSKVKEIVSGNVAKFSFYRKGELWYTIRYGDNEIFSFPVPIDDTEDATFNREEKALLMMRYVRKYLKEVEKTG